MLKAVDLRKGKTILHQGEPAVVHEAQYVAKGNKRSYMQTRIKNLKTGVIQAVRFRVDEMVEVPYVESKEYEYLYREGDNFIVMDTATYDQIPIASELFGDAVQWLVSNTKVSGQIFNGQLMGVELPHVVVLEITDTPPVVKGATATNQPKDAILETGARVRVPPFCENGMKIRVDTRSGEYLERA